MDVEAEITQHRQHLFALAYRLLGSASDAEDVLQNAFMRARTSGDDVINPRAWLSTIVTRLCLDELKSARRNREQYVGPWLPEPLATLEMAERVPDAEDRIGLSESVTMAVLLVLETLSPLERAVFLLREVFEMEFGEISDALGRNEAACRQLFSRARAHLQQKRPRFRPDPESAQRLTLAFINASQSGDVGAMAKLLAEDVVATSDSGGKVSAARREVSGRDDVSRFLLGLASKHAQGGTAEMAILNGQPAILLRRGGKMDSALILECGADAIHAVRIIRNPDKLERLDR